MKFNQHGRPGGKIPGDIALFWAFGAFGIACVATMLMYGCGKYNFGTEYNASGNSQVGDIRNVTGQGTGKFSVTAMVDPAEPSWVKVSILYGMPPYIVEYSASAPDGTMLNAGSVTESRDSFSFDPCTDCGENNAVITVTDAAGSSASVNVTGMTS